MRNSGHVCMGILLSMIMLGGLGCSNGAQQKQGQNNGTSPSDPTGNTGIGGPKNWAGGGNVGAGAANRPGAGFYVTATLKSGTSTGTGTYSAGGFQIDCNKGSADQIIVDLTIHIVKADGSQQYDSETSFKSACIDSAKITYAGLYTGDIGTLTVTIKSLDGKATSKGVADAFTQAASPTPTAPPASTDTTGTTGTTRPQFQRPTPVSVNITMKDV